MAWLQVVVIVSDGDITNEEDPFNEEKILKSGGVNIFAVGIGAWLKATILRNLATKPSYYGNRNAWMSLLETQLTTLQLGK